MISPRADVDPKRVRIGLVLVSVVFLACLVLAAVVDDPLGRAIMVAIAISAVVRAALLVRSLRRDAMDR